MIYWQPDDVPTTKNTSNLNDRQVPQARKMNACRSHTARFVQSQCAHSRGLEVSLLEYVVYCQEYPSPRYNLAMGHGYHSTNEWLEPLITMEEGSCEAHEICVNDMPLQQTTPGMVATCVDMNNFLPGPPNPRQTATAAGRLEAQNPQPNTTAHQSTSGGNQGGSPGENEAEEGFEDLMGWLVEGGIQGRRASVIVSGGNGTTPLGLQSLEVDTGPGSVSSAGGAGGGGGGKVQQQTCKDCFGLRTKKATPDADFLSTKATLMASTAITGLVWITVFSG